MRVLFVKLTSMGDLIHALPALTDAKRANPEITFDWVIEKSFSEVAQWHPAVANIIPTSHRKWRKNIWGSIQNGEIPTFLKQLRQHQYDLIIDGQTSTKSAVTMMLARGLRCGLDKNSAREGFASFAYQKQFFVSKGIHAITRLRQLFAQVLQYPFVDNQPDYGINQYSFAPPQCALPKPYVVFVHNASWETKLWPVHYWQKLITLAAADGLNVLLPWGNEAEKLRAQQISNNQPNAQVLPFCSLSEQAYILQQAVGAVCSDTGLSHLAAALNVPAVTIYGPTSIKLIGTTGLNQQHFVSPFPCTLCYRQQCNYESKYHQEPLCELAIRPELLWEKFRQVRG